MACLLAWLAVLDAHRKTDGGGLVFASQTFGRLDEIVNVEAEDGIADGLANEGDEVVAQDREDGHALTREERAAA